MDGTQRSAVPADRALFAETTRQCQPYESARYQCDLYVAEHGCKWRGLPERFGASLLSEALDCDLAAIEEELEQLCERPKSAATHRPRRQALPVHLPRVVVNHEPELKNCSCGCA